MPTPFAWLSYACPALSPLPHSFNHQSAAMRFAQLQRQLLTERLASDPTALGSATGAILQTDLRLQLPRLAMPVRVLESDATAHLLLQKPTASPAECHPYATQYTAVPPPTLAQHPATRHFVLNDVPDLCFQRLDRGLAMPLASRGSQLARPQ